MLVRNLNYSKYNTTTILYTKNIQPLGVTVAYTCNIYKAGMCVSGLWDCMFMYICIKTIFCVVCDSITDPG